MNLNPDEIVRYIQFLNDSADEIKAICNQIEDAAELAVQCMDSDSGKSAVNRLMNDMENIKRALPQIDSTTGRMAKVKSLTDDAVDLFRR